jgi:Zn-dependent peptidase ImmA (M78 family)
MDMKFQNRPGSILSAVRNLTPQRDVTFAEALRVAELQANRLLELSDITDAPVPDDIVLSLPRIERRYHRLRAASGMTYWNGRTWVVGINATEPVTRQRFTLLHEFKHIIDHGKTGRLYRGDRNRTAERQAELAADYFAGCVLVPKRQLRKAWYRGQQRVEDLARHFEVSTKAMEVRLQQVGLREDLVVEERPDFRPRLPERPAQWYFRSPHAALELHISGAS